MSDGSSRASPLKTRLLQGLLHLRQTFSLNSCTWKSISRYRSHFDKDQTNYFMQINIFNMQIAVLLALCWPPAQETFYFLLLNTKHNKDLRRESSILCCFCGTLSLGTAQRQSVMYVLSGSRTIFDSGLHLNTRAHTHTNRVSW